MLNHFFKDDIDSYLDHLDKSCRAHGFLDGELNLLLPKKMECNLVDKYCDGSKTTQFLKNLFEKLTSHAKSDIEIFTICVDWARSTFYHHLAGQYLHNDGTMICNPLANVQLRVARCGLSARAVCDLLAIGGFECNIFSAGCHTAAEVVVDGRPVFAEADLFPVGVHPCNEDGLLVSVHDILRNPDLVDTCSSYLHYDYKHINTLQSLFPVSYNLIEPWIRAPITPSYGMFGERFATTGKFIKRWKKQNDPLEWEKDRYYGWLSLETLTPESYEAVYRPQRPGQVQKVEFLSGQIIWKREWGYNSQCFYRCFCGNDTEHPQSSRLLDTSNISFFDMFEPIIELAELEKMNASWFAIVPMLKQYEKLAYLPPKIHNMR